MLLPHDWRDGRGAVRATVAVTERERGRARALVGHSPRGIRLRQAARPARQLPAPRRHHQPAAQRRRSSGVCETVRSRGLSGWSRPSSIHARHTVTHPSSGRQSHSGRRTAADAPLISVLTPVHDPPPHMLEEAIASVRVADVRRLGALPGRRRLDQPRGDRRPRAPCRLGPADPPQATRDGRWDLRRHQCRARTRHRRVHRPPGPRRRARPRRAPTRRRPDRPPNPTST